MAPHDEASPELAEEQFLLGVRYKEGDGVPQDHERAALWFRRAAEQGHARGQRMWAYCLYRGQGVGKDEREAVAWFGKAAEQGDAGAQCMLGYCLLKGSGTQSDAEQAAVWLHRAGEQGDERAQLYLADMYYGGSGVPRDKGEAARWFRLAAERGVVRAQHNLGVMLGLGDGVPRDLEQAALWLGKAVAQNYAESRGALEQVEHEQRKLVAEAWLAAPGRQVVPDGRCPDEQLVQALFSWFEAPPGGEAIANLYANSEDAYERKPEATASLLLPLVERHLASWPRGPVCPAELLERHVLEGRSYPLLRLFRQVHLEGRQLSPASISTLASHPDLGSVDSFFLVDTGLGDVELEALLAGIGPDRLAVLDIQDNALGDQGARSLARSTKLQRLTHLCLFRNRIGRESLVELLGSRAMPSLKSLSLGYQDGLDHRSLTEAVLSCRWLGQLESLYLEHSWLDDDDAIALGQASSLVGLRQLFLRGNELSEQGLRALRESPYLRETSVVSADG